MRLHRHGITEPTKKGVLLHKRWFATLYADDEGKSFANGHVETILRSPRPEFSVRFHVGTSASETPFDGHLTVLGSGVYWGLGFGRKLADWMTRETKHKWEGRDVSVRVHDSILWWSLWTHPNDHERGEFAPWRDGNTPINLLDRIYGRPRYWYENVSSRAFTIDMPEGSYPVTATLQYQLHGRPKSGRRVKSWMVDVGAPKGIPDHYDSSGGWKGDRVYGFGVPLRSRRDDWWVDAKAAITARVYKDRADSGFRRAQESDA